MRHKSGTQNPRQDKNGVMHAVSTGQSESGVYLTLYYGSGKITHFMPSRVVDHLKLELDRMGKAARKGVSA